jgi:DNA-directed RNA polymerase specialized sigma24 family protein
LLRSARPWLVGTVSNLCKRPIGLSRRRRERSLGDDALEDLPDTRVEPADGEIALRQALAALDKKSRSLCILIAIEGYAYDEVSAIMKLPIGSIGPMYIRAKSKMRLRMVA